MSNIPWHDKVVAARVRAHMPIESTIDLDAHAAMIGRTVAEAQLIHETLLRQPARLRQLERERFAELVERDGKPEAPR